MLIKINSDNSTTKNQTFIDQVREEIDKRVSRYAHQITRIEVYFTDDNSHKEGLNDKRCLLEVRMENLPPMAVSKYSSSHYLALESALDKLDAAIKKKIGKLRAAKAMG